MRNFVIVHANEHPTYKDFCRKKKGSISISYVDMLSTQEKYIVFDDDKTCNKVLECELFVKIHDSMKTILVNEKYHTILYYMDVIDETILDSFIDTILSYKRKLKVHDLDIHVLTLEELDKDSEVCLEKLKEKKQINLPNKEFIQQMF